MINRPYWLEKIKRFWERRSIVWLSGVRRTGKTTIAQMIEECSCIILNCERPRVRQTFKDPNYYFASVPQDSILVFDEVHRVDNPSQLLKIAADDFPNLKILATGSSTLAATKKFGDSLTGRKFTVHLPPIPWDECVNNFSISDLNKRMLHGGLPEPLLLGQENKDFYSEWIDSVFARDIQNLFDVRNRAAFIELFQMLLRQSGGQLDITRLSQIAEISRPTTYAYLRSMEIAHLIHLVRPYHHGLPKEIKKRPKCYAFDTGFIAYERGWDELRDEDRGILWEHLVLDMLRHQFPTKDIYYWQDKSNREIDFVIRGSRDELHLIECKMDPDRLSFRAISEFRRLYPKGRNLVLTPIALEPYVYKHDKFVIMCSNGIKLQDLLDRHLPDFTSDDLFYGTDF